MELCCAGLIGQIANHMNGELCTLCVSQRYHDNMEHSQLIQLSNDAFSP